MALLPEGSLFQVIHPIPTLHLFLPGVHFPKQVPSRVPVASQIKANAQALAYSLTASYLLTQHKKLSSPPSSHTGELPAVNLYAN